MNCSATELKSIIAELAPVLPGAFVRKIVQLSGDELVMNLAGGAKKFTMIISVSPQNSRAHLLSGPVEQTVPLDHFGRSLKKRLLRSCLSSVEQINNDRIIKIVLETAEGSFALVAELMGTRGNLYLLDNAGKVIMMAFNRKSPNRLGEPYLPPKIPDLLKVDMAPVASGGGPFAVNRDMERRYAKNAAEERMGRLKSAAVAPLRNEVKKAKKRTKSLENDRNALLLCKNDKKLGDLLAASFQLIEKGISTITLPDLFTDGAPIDIAIEPKLTPQENIARYYKRFRRYEKGLPRIDAERQMLRKKVAELTARISTIEAATDPAAIVSDTSHAPKKGSEAPKKRVPDKDRSMGRRFISSDGHLILVGRSDAENDQLTKSANGRDLWLHARDYPGSHVLVRLPKKIELPQKTLLEAAELALNYSKAVRAGKGEVTWSYAKWVKKPKGFKPGKVLVNDPNSIFVRIDKDNIAAMKERGKSG